MRSPSDNTYRGAASTPPPPAGGIRTGPGAGNDDIDLSGADREARGSDFRRRRYQRREREQRQGSSGGSSSRFAPPSSARDQRATRGVVYHAARSRTPVFHNGRSRVPPSAVQFGSRANNHQTPGYGIRQVGGRNSTRTTRKTALESLADWEKKLSESDNKPFHAPGQGQGTSLYHASRFGGKGRGGGFEASADSRFSREAKAIFIRGTLKKLRSKLRDLDDDDWMYASHERLF